MREPGRTAAAADQLENELRASLGGSRHFARGERRAVERTLEVSERTLDAVVCGVRGHAGWADRGPEHARMVILTDRRLILAVTQLLRPGRTSPSTA